MRDLTKNELAGKPLDRNPIEMRTKPLKAIWKKHLPRFDSAGVGWDQQPAAIGFCLADLNMRRAQKDLDADGVTVNTQWGEKPHPSIGLWKQSASLLVKYGEVLGLVGQLRKYGREDETEEPGESKGRAPNLLDFVGGK